MKVISYIEDAMELVQPCSCALGNFDGIHKGHQELIKEAVRIAKEKGLQAVVFTFSNHPVNELAGKTIVKKIMSIDEKAAVLEAMGVDYMVNVPFNASIRNLSPDDFVSLILVKTLKVKHAVCGFNYSFGFKALGNPKMLQEFGKENGFDLTVIPEFKLNDNTVSSTFIRGLISDGKLDKYIEYVGRTYKIAGTVIKGEKLGRKMGFPTANLNLSDDYAQPLNGVYVTKTYVNNQWFKSVTNVGHKPTVGEFAKNAETHIFGFDGDLYGKRVTVEFYAMLRPERKFDNIEELAEQINQDCLDAQAFEC